MLIDMSSEPWAFLGSNERIILKIFSPVISTLQSVSWSLAEFRHNKIVQSPHENYFNICRQHKEK